MVARENSSTSVGYIGILVFTLAELYYGVHKSEQPLKNEAVVKQFLSVFHIVHFDEEMSALNEKIRSVLEKSGKPVGNMDLLIASQTLSLKLTLITANENEFNRIATLKIENWLK
ncbi:MAG: type II toxin-antitoxin system VapC family toxin [Chitinophagales bacterium]|nr:type II toxin-antitoxin system VapC family toxin [Chitinophagales bacterium]